MINHLGNINGTPLYTDPYMNEDTILKGREGNSFYLIANPKTANIIYKSMLKQIRKEKLKKINYE